MVRRAPLNLMGVAVASGRGSGRLPVEGAAEKGARRTGSCSRVFINK